MQIYLVGGAVRDELLGYPFHEHDWLVVGARPEELLDQGFQQVGKDFPVFLHPDSKDEYALARRERKSGKGYHGFVCDFGPEVTVEEDLLRRDLTINAIAKSADGRYIDPYGGREDLNQRLLRHVSPAFQEDPLRVLRVARFAARYAHLGFRVADETLALMTRMSLSGELTTLSPERIGTELYKALSERQPSEFFRVLMRCQALPALYPNWAEQLDEPLLQLLDRASAENLTLDQRFALSCSTLSGTHCAELCERLKANKAASLLAVRCAELLPLPEPPEWLALLEKLDYLRRPEQLEGFVAVATLRGANADQLQRLQRAATAMGRINAAELSAEGLSGPALGKALRERRRACLEEMMQAAD